MKRENRGARPGRGGGAGDRRKGGKRTQANSEKTPIFRCPANRQYWSDLDEIFSQVTVKTFSFDVLNLAVRSAGPANRFVEPRGRKGRDEPGIEICVNVSLGHKTHQTGTKLQGIDNEVNPHVSLEFGEQTPPASAAVSAH